MEGPDNSPWKAKWCWPAKHLPQPWNYYAYFRKVVKLPQKPVRAAVRISADSRYALYVNGRRVHQGPARSFPQHQSYDTLDLLPFLEAGDNAICAIVQQFGVPTFFSQYRDVSGFLVDGVIECGGEAIELHTPDGWLCRETSGWRKNVVRLSVQMGFQEHFDADADPAGWMLPGYQAAEADGWKEPWTAGPVGCHPWLLMEPRGVPLLKDRLQSFKAIVAQFRGENGRGYKITADVYHFVQNEERKKEKNLIDNAEGMLTDDVNATTISPPSDSDFIAAVFDLGTYRTGHFMLDITEADGDEIIDVIFSEDLDKSQFPMLLGSAAEPTICQEAPALRYRCRPGAQQWESFQYLGMRYMTVIFRNIAKPLKVRWLGLRQVHAGVDPLGKFECSDDRLNRIWQAAANTQLNCAFDALVDCPAREQAQWCGDLRIQSSVMLHAFGDTSLHERGIRQVAQSQAVDGSLHAHPPADIPSHRLPDFMLSWVGSLHDYYQQTGRLELVRECLPAMHRLFDFFERHESDHGLIGAFDGFWVFLDWAPLHKTDFSAVLNLQYLQALRWASSLCRVVGDAAAASRYRKAADALAAEVIRHFWDVDAKLWRDGFDPATGEQIEVISQHANSLGILLQLMPEHDEKIARDVLIKSSNSRRSKIITASPFFYAMVLEALAHCDLREEAIEIIRDKWGDQIEQGATTFWEKWEPNSSRCHGWSASPLYFLSQWVLGVMPLEAGWKSIRIQPIAGKLEFARGVVPSPLGLIRVEWERSEEDQLAMHVELPEGMTAEFIGPLGEKRRLEAGSHQFHT